MRPARALLLHLVAVAALILPGTAGAADWVTLQGTEPDDPDKARLRPQGFVQVSAEGYAARAVDGAALPAFADFDGQHPTFNTVDGRAPFAVLLRRIRAGVRGDVPGSEGLASVNLSLELGQNPQTFVDGRWIPRLVDASLSVNLPADLHLRLGRFKAPLSDETLEAFFLTTDLIRFNRPTGQLLMERDAHEGTFAGPIDAFRDVGGQIAGSHLVDRTEVSWAVMGGTATVDLTDLRPEPNVTGRVQVSRLLGDARRRSPFRDAVEGWVFATYGTRRVGDAIPDRLRAGAGAQLRHQGLRLRTEVLYAHGVLVAGIAPPFAGNPRPVAVEGEAWGLTGLATYRIQDTWQLGATFSHLDRDIGGGPKRRVFNDATLLAGVFITPRLWFTGNVGLRHGHAPEGSEAVNALLDTTAPFLGVQATAAM